MPVILLWPPLLQSRSWDRGFLTPHLDAFPADAVVEDELGSEESTAWLTKLGIKPSEKKWWHLFRGKES